MIVISLLLKNLFRLAFDIHIMRSLSLYPPIYGSIRLIFMKALAHPLFLLVALSFTLNAAYAATPQENQAIEALQREALQREEVRRQEEENRRIYEEQEQ